MKAVPITLISMQRIGSQALVHIISLSYHECLLTLTLLLSTPQFVIIIHIRNLKSLRIFLKDLSECKYLWITSTNNGCPMERMNYFRTGRGFPMTSVRIAKKFKRD